MLPNFDEIKGQLAELADTINKFKSEAVQLRVVDLILGNIEKPTTAVREPGNNPASSGTGKKRRSRKASGDREEASTLNGPKKKAVGGTGAVATLGKVYQEGFFGSPRTIGDILKHCETNLARRIKANEISGKLGRMVRSNELKRSKNADNQYEYKNV